MTATATITHEAHSVSDFIQKIKDLPPPRSGFYAYRGEADIDWAIRPGILRPEYSNVLTAERDATRDLISVHPHEFDPDQTMSDRLVRMQHFGLPTRLLDVTGNPLVALFNACSDITGSSNRNKDGKVNYISVPPERRKYYDSDTISCVANLANLSPQEKDDLLRRKSEGIEDFNDPERNPAADRLLQFIKAEKPSFRAIIRGLDLDRLWYVVPKLSNRRIIAQNGAFLIFGLTDRPIAPSDIGVIQIKAIKIPENAKRQIRNDLKLLGITESALFPEIDKAAAFIKERYR